jgi:hypothetical protein
MNVQDATLEEVEKALRLNPSGELRPSIELSQLKRVTC